MRRGGHGLQAALVLQVQLERGLVVDEQERADLVRDADLGKQRAARNVHGPVGEVEVHLVHGAQRPAAGDGDPRPVGLAPCLVRDRVPRSEQVDDLVVVVVRSASWNATRSGRRSLSPWMIAARRSGQFPWRFQTFSVTTRTLCRARLAESDICASYAGGVRTSAPLQATRRLARVSGGDVLKAAGQVARLREVGVWHQGRSQLARVDPDARSAYLGGGVAGRATNFEGGIELTEMHMGEGERELAPRTIDVPRRSVEVQ